jgi:hypothetical protein
MRTKMRRATVLTALVLVALALMLGVRWAFNTSAAAPTGNLTCSVKASCDAGEVEVLRTSSTTNAHAGTPSGSAYGWSVCCGEVCNLSTDCSDVYDTVVTLSAADNAHVAADGSYATQVCLSVPYGVADCTYGATCDPGYECVATVSGDNNAHVADCDGTDDYATKVCCRIVDDCDNDTVLDPDDPDDDGDEFNDDIEAYLSTDSCDDCTNEPGVHDAWPLDIDMTRDIDVTGDVWNYVGRIGATGGHASNPSCPEDTPMWWQRLDLEPDCTIDVTGDVWNYVGKIGMTCT